jgi:mycothione reductase
MERYDLVIVGAGSGNTLLTPDFDDWDVAIVERGVFGGTCLNRGCIPSKMFVYAADVAEQARHSDRLGVASRVDGVDWPAIRDRVFGRIDPIAAGGEAYRHSLERVTVHKASARFVAPRRLVAGDTEIEGRHVVLAAGARPYIPDVPGLAEVGYHTSDTIMRVDRVPERLLVMGGGYIACELAHVFGAFGSAVTIINRSASLLRWEDHEVAARFTELYGRRFDLLLHSRVLTAARRADGTIVLEVEVDGAPRTVEGDALLVATGRVPNSDELDVGLAGVKVDHDGFVLTDDHLHTHADGVWALGDITNPAMLKHTANAEARIVAHNIAHPDDLRRIDRSLVPHAVFGHPQVAAIGRTEHELQVAGLPYVAARRDYAATAYGWAMEDTDSFCKLLADPTTDRLLGAHIIGAQASTLLQQLVQGMRFGQTVTEMANDQLYIHPALSEVVEQALLALLER